MATVAVSRFGRLMKVRAKRKSFHAWMKSRIAAVKTPGAESGTVIFQKACMRVAPSTRADSSSSLGNSLKKAVSVQMQMGSVKVTLGRINARYLLVRPQAL